MKALSAIVLVYLATGVPGAISLLSKTGAARVSGVAYVACIVVGAGAALAAFRSQSTRIRIPLLWAIGLSSLVYVSNELSVVFPTLFNMHIPIAFGTTYSNGQFTRVGIDLVPAILFLLVWFATKRSEVVGESDGS